MNKMRYYRIHTAEIAYKTGLPVGIFVAVWRLVEAKKLTAEEEGLYWENRSYFEKVLPVPPYYEKGNPDGAVTWFKDTEQGNDIYRQMDFYRKMLKKYGVKFYKSSTQRIPGRVIYEDDFQIAVVGQNSESEITTEETE